MSLLTPYIEKYPQLQNLASSLSTLTPSSRQLEIIRSLLEDGQHHLFAGWQPQGVNDQAKREFLHTLQEIDANYPSGLMGYIQNARTRLAESKSGSNSFAGYAPEKPDVIDMTKFDHNYVECENRALHHLDKLGVVLVAGGLGERLGYSGIKVNIAVESVLKMSYLHYYAKTIKAMQQRVSPNYRMPFVIMTSDQTHDKTIQTLKENNWYGLAPDQVHLITQKLVPAVSNDQGHLALEGPYELILKPHGHGDIHMLMHTSGLARKLHEKGIEHLLFIQDTNGQVFNAALSALGVSLTHNLDFNALAVKRVPKEAVGALTRLTKAGAPSMTLNVEYNLLDPLLRATISPEGDVADTSGYSPFPGNINVLIIKMDSYLGVLDKTKGIIAEFVNPKYADASRTTFKSPTRLETMMQDLPKLYMNNEKVGVSVFDRSWCFSANKNNLEDARKKYETKAPPESAITAEADFYAAGRTKAEFAGSRIKAAEQILVEGVPYIKGPRIFLAPSFALSLEEVRQKLRNCSFADECTLYLCGPSIRLENVALSRHASLIINAIPEAEVTVRGLTLQNSGHTVEFISREKAGDPQFDESDRLRMFVIRPVAPAIYEFNQPGRFVIDASGRVIKEA
jgi:UDP-sugar pyrophosphorylase